MNVYKELSGMTSGTGYRRRIWAWVVAGVAVAAVAAIGHLFPPDDWYRQLAKPTWQPPGWLFAPVWASLYLLLFASFAFLLESEPSRDCRRAAALYVGHLLLNAAWPFLFFALHQPILAFLDICALWLVTLGAVFTAARVRPLSAALLLPMLIWISFALVLNGVIIALN